VLEYLISNGLETPLQIFGTDASERSIEMARSATYPDTLAAEISPERMRRFFVKKDRGYQVSKRVRDCCIFARQNLSSDPPFSHIDLLTCRNVLIYFNQTLQRQVIATFHYALEPNGYMLLGSSETLRDFDDAFTVTDRKYKVYQRKSGALGDAYRLPMHHAVMPLLPGSAEAIRASDAWPDLELQRAADRIVLARFGPPGLIIDDDFNVLQARGQTAPYVELSSGVVSWNLGRVVRDGLVSDVVECAERAVRENVPVSRAATLKSVTGDRRVQIDVLPIGGTGGRARCFMILFSDIDEHRSIHTVEQPQLPPMPDNEKDRLNLQLRQDLSSTRYHLQSLVEERDARNQELVSANEEIQSANEELQSTNEELETTKEELQSTNEELQSTNGRVRERHRCRSLP